MATTKFSALASSALAPSQKDVLHPPPSYVKLAPAMLARRRSHLSSTLFVPPYLCQTSSRRYITLFYPPKSKEVAPAQPPKPIKTQRKRRREDDDDTDAVRPPAQDTGLTRSAKKRLDAGSTSRHADEDDAPSMHEFYTAGAIDDDTGSVFESDNYSDPEGDEEDMFLSSEDNEDEADQPDEDNKDEANLFEDDADQSDEDNKDEANQFEDEVNQSDEASQSDDDADINHADDDDMKETQYSVEIPLRDQDLFNVDVTAAEVTSMVETVLPALSSRKMKKFYRTIAGHLEKSPPFRITARSRHPTTWSLVNPDFDLLWKHSVDGERALDLGDPSLLPRWLNMSEDGLVKPIGSFTDTLLLISSYPTASEEGSVHNRYGTVDDMSNVCMWMLYAKFGFHVADIRSHGVMHIDIMARRLDQNLIPGYDGDKVFQITLIKSL